MPDFPQPIEYDVLPTAVMDYSTLKVIGRVAREALKGARLRRVDGLKTRDVILSFDRFGMKDSPELDRWLFSANARLFRVHPWPEEIPDRTVSTHLVEVMSHHLGGARVDDVEVTHLERIITFHFVRREYTGDEMKYRFIAELMGKHSNLILVDSENTILASYKPVHSYQSRVREIRAGKEYQPPPPQDRIEPREFSPDEWRDFINSAKPAEQIDDLIARTFHGMSNLSARAACDRAEVSPETMAASLSDEDAEKLRVAFYETNQLIEAGLPLWKESPDDFALRVAADFIERAEDIRIDQARSQIARIIDRRRKKLRSLEDGLSRDLEKAERADEYKKKADLLLANLHNAVLGQDQLTVDDWETGEKVVLSLDPYLTPQEQAESWYDRYRKLSRAKDIATERKRGVHAEREELTKLEERLAGASTLDEIGDIRRQCVFHGLISPEEEKPGKGRGKKSDTGRPGMGRLSGISAKRYRSNDGFLILAGTSDNANDALRRASSPDDIWLHTRDIPGGHVYIISRGKEVPETTLKEAGMVAVWHSKARDGSNVPVDYTRAKYIEPIPGGPAGKVRFKRERTIRVTPDEKRLEKMRMMAGETGE
jgi:predicted ribosome quality control (RQC) complex YloA/Tae2 family protein